MPSTSAAEPKIRKVDMTPELAEKILGKNTLNRPLRPSRVERYARDMAEGRWKGLNGETIIISEKSNLMNGQHRLHAVIKSGVTVRMMIAEGVQEDAFATMDAGMTRKAADVLKMRGVVNFNQVAAMTRVMLNYRDGSSLNRPVSTPEIEAALIKHPEIENYATAYSPFFPYGRSVGVAVCMIADLFGDEDSSEKILEFSRGVSTGIDLSAYDPRLIYRNKMIGMSQDRQRRPEQSVVWYFTQRALTHYLDNSKLTKLVPGRGVVPFFSEIPSATREMVRAKW